MMAIVDAGTQQRLGQSPAFPSPTSDCQTLSFEFTTTPATQAVVLEFMRAENSYPIFGELWLDDFLITDVTSDPQR